MTQNDYQPVSCEMHSELELAIMHRTELQISWQSDDATITDTVLAIDIYTQDQQEFLSIENNDRHRLDIRLDKILHIEKTIK